ncbi:MAG: CBS domain-containing protein [Actinobacteria bacterium]|nr:CBS domain-containing protein [Actinomycetota bacterium]
MQLSTIIAAKGGFVATIQPDATVSDLVAMLSEHGVGAIVVSVDGRNIVGIASERDVVRAISVGVEALQQPVASIMTTHVYCAPPESHIDELMHIMTEKRVRHIPVTDPDGALLGIVSIGDVVKSRLGELEGERAALLEYITQS